MSDWRTVTLGEITENHDARRRPVKTTERVPGPYPYYGASGIIDSVEGFMYDGEYLLIAEDGENLRTRSTPVAFLASGQFWVNNHAHVVQGNKFADTRFLSHLFAVTDITGYLTGSTRPKLTRSAMDSIILEIPAKTEQIAIAEVLGALDDKVAANAKLVANVTDLSTLLLAGEVPTSSLSDVVTHQKKSVNPQRLVGQVLHYSLPAFDAGQRPELTDAESIKSSKFCVENPCVLVSKLNPRFPRVWDVPRVGGRSFLASTEFLVLESTYSSSSVLWAILSHPSFGAALEAKVAGTSGSHQRVRPADLLATEVIDTRTLSAALQDQLTSLGQYRINYREESAILAATRDALLPQLMSGKLRVRDAEKTVEEVL